jgi:hypothetical protein
VESNPKDSPLYFPWLAQPVPVDTQAPERRKLGGMQSAANLRVESIMGRDVPQPFPRVPRGEHGNWEKRKLKKRSAS